MAFQTQIEKLFEVGKEKILFVKLKNKDKNAFVQAYDKYVDQIYRFIYFKVSDVDEANDLTSQVFLKTWNHIQSNGISDEKSLRAFFYRVARNVVIDYYRAESKKETVPLDLVEGFVADKISLEGEVRDKLDAEKVLSRLNELKSEYREVMVFHFVEELSIKEIAEALGKTSGNVRVILHRAIKTYKQIINEQEY